MTDTTACMSSQRHDWETPDELFGLLDAEFHFTLDVCATKRNRKCKRYFNRHDNGLTKRWTGTCYMNPPYGREIGDWLAKAVAESTRDRGATVVCLVPARTDTKWWWDSCLQAHEIRFLKGRLRFKGAPQGATFPSAIVIFYPRAAPTRWPNVCWWDWQSGGRPKPLALWTQKQIGEQP